MTHRLLAALVALVVTLGVLAATTADAQSILVRDGTGLVCSTLGDTCDPTETPSTTCTGDASACVVFNGSIAYCAPPDALWCNRGLGCPDGMRSTVPLLGVPVCVPDAVCFVMTTTVEDCFHRPDDPSGPFVVWEAGDCDLDGQVNDADPDPCSPAPPIGVARPDGTCAPAALCADDAECDGTGRCEMLIADDPHHYCLPGGALVECCGGDRTGCSSGATCEAGVDAFCVDPGYCPSLAFHERIACVRFGDQFVAPEAGDCDGDGIPNAAETDPLDPCVFDDVDAGTPRVDAGTTDAGNVMDGSVPPTSEPPTFSGGGGCRCHAAPAPRAPSFAWLLALGGLFVRRRRSRPHAS